MATGTLTLTHGWTYSFAPDEFPGLNKQLTITIADKQRFVKKVTVSHSAETTISLADVPTPGWCKITNLDGTNFVKVGPATGVYMVAPQAGEPQYIRLLPTQANLYALADTADVDILLEVVSA